MMNYNQQYKLRSNLIKECVSQDATRYNLGGVYHCEKNKQAVVTDGHRLYLDKGFYQEALKGLIVVSNVETVQGDFPNYEQVIPKLDQDNKISVLVDANLNTKKSKTVNRCFLNKIDGLYSISHNQTKDSLISLNAHYIKGLEGFTFDMHYKSKNDPLVIEIVYTHAILVVMPMSKETL